MIDRERRRPAVLLQPAAVLTLIVVALAGVVGSRAAAAAVKSSSALPCVQYPSTTTPAPSTLLSILGVLRRPATPGENPPAQALSHQSGLYVNAVRFARSAFGRRWFVWVDRSPPDCMPGVTLFGFGANGGAGGSGGGAAQIESGGMWLSESGGTGADPGRTLFAGIVPDGVATVTLQYPAGKLGGFSRRSGPALTVTGHAVNNVVVVVVERAGEQATGPVTTTWRAANGSILRTLHGSL